MRVWLLLAMVALAGCSKAGEPELAPVDDVVEAQAVPGVRLDVGDAWWNTPTIFELEGPDANWLLDVDGDGVHDHEGETLPATVEHTYGRVGQFNVTFWTAASKGPSAFQVIQVAGEEIIHAEAKMQLIAHSLKHHTSYRDCIGLITDEPEMDCLVIPVPAMAPGIRYAMSGTPDPMASFLDGCSATATEVRFEDEPSTGDLPEGTRCVVVWGYGADFATLVVDIGPPGAV